MYTSPFLYIIVKDCLKNYNVPERGYLMSFSQKIKEMAKAKNATVVLPETDDIRTLTAAETILKEGIANLILIGNKDALMSQGHDIGAATFIDPNTYDLDPLVTSLYELRKSKGMTQEEARELLINNSLYLGVMLVKEGIAGGMVAGAVNSTSDVLRASLQIIKTAPGSKLVSSFFVMDIPGYDSPFVFSDCGLVQDPNAEELASIAASSAISYKALVGGEPLVAMLSHSTRGSSKHALVDKVVEATNIAKKENPTLKIDGEMQLDAAIVPAVASKKASDSEVAGKANVLVFPNLDAGNIGYKLVERFAKAQAFGPITQGLAKPINDLSRGCSAEDIVGVTAITALQI